jgi:hypothetical protein
VRARSYFYFRKRVIGWEPTARHTRDVGEVRPEARIDEAREGGRVPQRGETAVDSGKLHVSIQQNLPCGRSNSVMRGSIRKRES